MKRLLLLLPLFAAACHSAPAPGTRDLLSIKVPTADGGVFDLSALKKSKAFVLVFLAPDCPLSQNYTLTLNTLSREFDADGVEFLGVVAGEWFSETEVRQFAETYKVRFPVLLDRDFRLANATGATITPEVFALDTAGEIFYKGAIDDASTDLGQHRTLITEHYLREALTAHLKGQIPAIAETQAVGCFIERAD